MNWRKALTSRFVVVPGLIALASACWSAYAERHAGGRVTGRAMLDNGQPAAGATIVIGGRNITSNFVEHTRVKTDSAGRFRIDDNPSHMLRIHAVTGDGQQSDPVIVRLWFRSQDVDLVEPVTVRARQ